MIKDFKGKFGVMIENVIGRYQSGGFLTGDIVKFRKDTFKNPIIASKGDNVKAMIQNAMGTDLPIVVHSVKSKRPNSSGNYTGGFGYATDAPTDFFIDIAVQYAPGLYRDVMTVPAEVLELDNPEGVNLPDVADSLKRPAKVTKPEDNDADDKANQTLPSADTKQSHITPPKDGKDYVKKPVKRKSKVKESTDLSSLYGEMIEG